MDTKFIDLVIFGKYLKGNQTELLQSEAQAERELTGSPAVWSFGVGILY